jgi:hypothetical protein
MSYDIEKFIYKETPLIPINSEETISDMKYLLDFLKSVETHLNSTLPFRTKILDGIINDIQESIALKNNIDNAE